MGTRSITHIVSDEFGQRETLCTIYRQFDGHFGVAGAEMADFLAQRHLVNGYGSDKMVFNGAGDLATQLIAFLKAPIEPGNVYLMAPGANDVGEEYIYTIEAKNHEEVVLSAESIHDEDGFSGSPAEYLQWLKESA